MQNNIPARCLALMFFSSFGIVWPGSDHSERLVLTPRPACPRHREPLRKRKTPDLKLVGLHLRKWLRRNPPSSDGAGVNLHLTCYVGCAEGAGQDMQESSRKDRVAKRRWRRNWRGNRGECFSLGIKRATAGKNLLVPLRRHSFLLIAAGSLRLALDFESIGSGPQSNVSI
jgi:hypothetical protein